MAKITPVVLIDQPNKGGMWNVKIRVGHKSKSTYIATDEYVSQKHLTKDNDIKPGFIVSHLTDLLNKYNEILKANKYSLPHLTHIQVKDLLENNLNSNDKEGSEIYFMSFCREYIEGIKVKNTKESLQMACNRLNDYLGSVDIPAKQITSSFLRGYEEYLRKPAEVMRNRNGVMLPLKLKAGTNTTVNGHMNRIRSLHNFAKEKYNDEEIGKLLIPNNPFKKYIIVDADDPDHRDYSIEQVAKIRDCVLRAGSRAELTRDIWMLSFYLCGINSADIYRLPAGDFERIEYNRKKTAGRRTDKAFMSVKLIDEARPIYEKYAGKLKKRYTEDAGLNHALSMGMKVLRVKLGKGFENLDPYSARHSFATIAHNDCGYLTESVGRALNHGENKRNVTNRYIRKSWDIVDKIQADVVALLPTR